MKRPLKESLRSIITRNEGRKGRAWLISIQLLIVLALVGFSIDTLPDLEPATRIWLFRLEVFTVIVFTLEYLLRVVIAERPLKFIFSFYGLVDLFAILPFYIATTLDLRGIRAVRLLRLLRLLKLVRYSKAMQRYRRAFFLIKEELALFFFTSAIILFIAAVGIYHFENPVQPDNFQSVFHSLWWAVATLTTVGYGDVYPITLGGRVFTSCILLVGLGIVAVPTGLISSALSAARNEELELSKTDAP